MKTPRRMSSGRRSLLIVAVAVVCSLLTGTQAALAEPTVPGAPAGSGMAGVSADTPQAKAQRPTQAFDPQVKLPQPLTIPGTGETIAPLTSPLKPTEPTALPGAAKASGAALMQDAKATAVSPSSSSGDTNGGGTQAAVCEPSIYGSTYVGNDPTIGPYSDTVYVAGVSCNFVLRYMSGVSSVVDWTQHYEGVTGYVGSSFGGTGSSGASHGSVEMQGDLYDGGRYVEIILDLYLHGSGIWGACNAIPGLRYLLCVGLGTNTLHVIVGTGAFWTGLQAPVARWAALGDSYSSGTGAATYMGPPNPPGCRRSLDTYSYRMGGGGLRIGDRGERISIDTPNLKACHGARFTDFFFTQTGEGAETRQLDHVTRRTRLVTLTVGGNDVGFAPRLRACVTGDCSAGPLVTAQEAATLQEDLIRLYRTIRSQMRHNSLLVVLSYPAFLPNPDDPAADPQPSFERCPIVNSQLTIAELRRIYEAAVLVNNTVNGAVTRLGDSAVRFVNQLEAFRGHRICSDDTWANGTNLLDIPETFHPNNHGYVEMGSQLIRQVGIGT